MQQDDLIVLILDSLNWFAEDDAKAKHGQSPSISKERFIRSILQNDVSGKIQEDLDIGAQTLHRMFKALLVPILGSRHGGNDTWKTALLYNANIKSCGNCKEYLTHSSFTINNHSWDGLDSLCKQCKTIKNSTYYKNNKDIYHKVYIEEHRQEYNARNAYRRAMRLQATPVWADIDKIKNIYNTCPEGYHVDHIYPLLSDWVCGLHVHENLQHLSAKDNMQKGNRKVWEHGEIR